MLALALEDALFIIEMDADVGGGIVLLFPIEVDREGLADAMLG